MPLFKIVSSLRLAYTYLLLLLPSIATTIVWESSSIEGSATTSRPNHRAGVLLCQAFSSVEYATTRTGTRSYHSPTTSRLASLTARNRPNQPPAFAGDSRRTSATTQSLQHPFRRTDHHLRLCPIHVVESASFRNDAEIETIRTRRAWMLIGQASGTVGRCPSSIRMSAADLDETEKSEEVLKRSSLIRRAWSKTYGRASSVAKVLLKPARYLLQKYKAEEPIIESNDEDEGTYLTEIENLAAVEERSEGGKKAEAAAAVLETRSKEPTTTTTTVHNAEPAANLDFADSSSVEDIMQKAQTVADIAKEAVMTSLQDLQQVSIAPEEQTKAKAIETLKKEEDILVADTDNVDDEATTGTWETVADLPLPKGERWAVSSPDTNLTGRWKIVVTDDFKQQYDAYLKHLGQPMLVRSIALSIIGMTKEETRQTDQGRQLWIRGTNTRGIWERTLHSSGSDFADHVLEVEDYEHRRVPIMTADSERVEAEAWWEKGGTVHRSWLRGGKKYGGGDFESNRYLSDEKTLVCKTIFHPKESGREKAQMTWTFQREE